MLFLITLLVAFGAQALAANQTVSVFLPIIDAQPLVASLAKQVGFFATNSTLSTDRDLQDGDIQTLVVKCPDGTESSKCGFQTPATVTAGPSTLALTTVIGNSITVDLKCGIEKSTKASCTQVYTGPASLYTTGNGVEPTKITSWTASQTLEGSKVTYLPVTITAGASKGVAAATPTAGLRHVLAAGLLAALVV